MTELNDMQRQFQENGAAINAAFNLGWDNDGGIFIQLEACSKVRCTAYPSGK